VCGHTTAQGPITTVIIIMIIIIIIIIIIIKFSILCLLLERLLNTIRWSIIDYTVHETECF
jgi:hypothetical protein